MRNGNIKEYYNIVADVVIVVSAGIVSGSNDAVDVVAAVVTTGFDGGFE